MMMDTLTRRLSEMQEEREQHAGMVRYYDRMIEATQETIAQHTLNGQRKPQHGSKMVEELREATTQIKALEILARKNGNQVKLKEAAGLIRMAGLSRSKARNLENTLRHRVSENENWELLDQDNVRFIPRQAQTPDMFDKEKDEPESQDGRSPGDAGHPGDAGNPEED